VEPSTPTVPGLAEQPELAVRQLREAGVTGVLTYSDEDCRLHAVSLPDLAPVRAPSFRMCRPLTDSGGLGVSEGGVVWAGLGLGVIQEVLPREVLARALEGRIDGCRAGVRAVQAVSLGDERYVVLAECPGEEENRVVAGFDGTRLLFAHPAWRVGGARLIRPSPAGEFYALLGRDPLGDRLYDRDGHGVGVPAGISGPLSVAWSPDDRWTALATPESVYVFPSQRPEGQIVRIPLAVNDLDWSEAASTRAP
jgi:hypothetical protein